MWAERAVASKTWYGKAGNYFMGGLAALWTPETYKETALTLGSAWSSAGWASRTGPRVVVQKGKIGLQNFKWKFGNFKSATKWQNQLNKRGWTKKQITEAIKQGKQHVAPNNVNPNNPAIRFVHPKTGKSVVIDSVTEELLHIGGKGFVY